MTKYVSTISYYILPPLLRGFMPMLFLYLTKRLQPPHSSRQEALGGKNNGHPGLQTLSRRKESAVWPWPWPWQHSWMPLGLSSGMISARSNCAYIDTHTHTHTHITYVRTYTHKIKKMHIKLHTIYAYMHVYTYIKTCAQEYFIFTYLQEKSATFWATFLQRSSTWVRHSSRKLSQESSQWQRGEKR